MVSSVMFLIAAVIPFVAVPLVMAVLAQLGELKRRNFLGQPVTTSGGIAICLSLVIQLAIACPLLPPSADLCALVSSVSVLFLVLGLADDLLGEPHWRGFKGHVEALISHGRITTGLVKVIGGVGGTALILHWQSDDTLALNLFGIVLICLSANAINLFDKRPSRALKAFWILCLPSIALVSGDERLPLVMLILSTLPYAFYDFKCRAMLGDAGANMLGAALGGFIWAETHFLFKVAIAFLLIALHTYAERHSLTDVIAKFEPLRRFDELGVWRRI